MRFPAAHLPPPCPKATVLLALIAAMAAFAVPAVASCEPVWGDWRDPPAKSRQDSVGVRMFRFYQNHLSSEDGAACPMYPTCSAFGLEAVTKRGLLLGSLLTVDRLLSEYPGVHRSHLYPLITKYDTHRLYDPVVWKAW